MNIQDASELVLEKLEAWARTFIAMLPNLAIAIVIVLIGYVLARAVRNLIHKTLRKTTHHSALLTLVTNVVYVSIILIAAFIALGVLDLDKTVTSLLAGAGIVGLALGFAFQDIASNFMAGVFMAVRKPFDEGDIIESEEKMGVVTDMSLRATIVRSFQGQYHIIPNKNVFQGVITNYTRLGRRRIDLAVGVSYGDDLEKVKKVTLEAVKSIPTVLQNEDISLYFNEFGDSSINFSVRFWATFKKQTDFLQAQSDAIMAIKKAYDENDIMIPFPIRTLDFGIKGGEKLNEVWPK
ncbi:mechanosensitive ion channel family protein [Nafulsella turpanensis]|uniref:mechanosensitive ion channel family protein n=1 Tax=Nafulsella turpanensis TaxID=1265690 RepID=UPI00034DA210|nr:mechanosensitive ion channel [Nafulsella turpanensis]